MWLGSIIVKIIRMIMLSERQEIQKTMELVHKSDKLAKDIEEIEYHLRRRRIGIRTTIDSRHDG
jgi:hypothetical protein